MKCPKCGYEDRFRTSFGDPDLEVCRIDQDPSLERFPIRQLVIEGPYAYMRLESGWVRRVRKDLTKYRSKTLHGPPSERGPRNKKRIGPKGVYEPLDRVMT